MKSTGNIQAECREAYRILIIENQMEKNMENDMETGNIGRYYNGFRVLGFRF